MRVLNDFTNVKIIARKILPYNIHIIIRISQLYLAVRLLFESKKKYILAKNLFDPAAQNSSKKLPINFWPQVRGNNLLNYINDI